MTKNSLTFENQKLVVDYFSFKFQKSEWNENRIDKIGKYFLNLGFNSFLESRKLSKPIRETKYINSKNQYEIWFILDHPHWEGTLLHFTGLNAARFYLLVRQNSIDWKILDGGTLSRFDLYYERKYQEMDTLSGKDFLGFCQKELKQKNRNTSLEKNKKGWIYKIGNRKANNYSRIYEGKNCLRFEHEMKGRVLREYHSLLFENHLDKFEENLSSYFFIYFGKVLPLQHSYLDWLVLHLRPLGQKLVFKNSFNSDYIKSEIKTDPEKLITLLQFLNYAQSLSYELTYIDKASYRVVIFRLQDFLQFQNKSNNQYQVNKIKEFFEELQKDILITSFTNTFYQSLVAVPLVRFDKIQKFWVGKVWLVEELFYYKYPFFLPNFFNTKLTKDQFNVGFKFIQTFTTVNLEKTFLIKEFLINYPCAISNQRKHKIKKYFLELVRELEDNNLIESNYKILSKGSSMSVDQLTPQNINEGFIIYEKLNI